MENQVFTSDAAKELGIGVSTLRKYAALLEAKGYTFDRGLNNGRIFGKEDLHYLTKMIELITNDGISVEQAAEEIADAAPKKEKNFNEPNRTDEELKEFIALIKDLEIQQASLTKMNRALAKQVEILTEKIEGRERDQQLFQLAEHSRQKKKRKGIVFFR